MTKDQLVKIISIVLSAALAIAMVFGYDIGVIQPRESALLAGGPGAPGTGTVQPSGTTNYDDLSLEGDLSVTGTSAFTGAATFTAAPVWNAASMTFEGATADAYETTLSVTDPASSDKTITLPNATGTVGLFSGATKAVFGSSTITATATLTHGLTTPLYALCTLGADELDNQEQSCTVTVAGSTVTGKVWKEDGAAGDSGVVVYWMVVGTP